jgi:hypothetical protein
MPGVLAEERRPFAAQTISAGFNPYARSVEVDAHVNQSRDKPRWDKKVKK